MPENNHPIIEEIKKTLNRLVIATTILFVAFGGVSLYAYHVARTNENSAHTNQKALCALRTNLEREVNSTKDFLIAHPEGFPKLGLTATVLSGQLVKQEKSIKALSILNC